MMIASTANRRVRETAALAKKAGYRDELGVFVVEGPRMFAEIPREQIVNVYATETFLREHDSERIWDGIR